MLPLLLFGLACYYNDELILSLMDANQVRSFEGMYDPTLDKLGRERQSDTDLAMFGFYIYNNIGISFRCFALGLFAGIGSLFMMVYNGLAIGGVAGHLTGIGFAKPFYGFVAGHGAFELTAIVFSGAAGLKLGYALINPKSLGRISALRLAASDAIKIMYGSTLMLLIAAFIEAFWSSTQSLPFALKIGVGLTLWLLVIGYCCLAGREHYAAR